MTVMDIVNAAQEYLNGNGAANPFFVAVDAVPGSGHRLRGGT